MANSKKSSGKISFRRTKELPSRKFVRRSSYEIHDAYSWREYNLRHEMLEITCLEELLMDVVDLK